ncbi:hypothetical protein DMENIID0001_056750 [Sergentomyia squamirostris]
MKNIFVFALVVISLLGAAVEICIYGEGEVNPDPETNTTQPGILPVPPSNCTQRVVRIGSIQTLELPENCAGQTLTWSILTVRRWPIFWRQ